MNIDSHEAENLGERRKMHMKKFATMLCAAVMTASLSIAAIAAPSIGELIPEGVQLTAGSEYIEDGYTLVVQNVQTDKYTNEKVRDIIDEFNADDSTLTIQDVMETLGVDLEGENKTTDDNVVDLKEYKALMPAFADLVLKKEDIISYELKGEDAKIEASFKLELAKELNKDDLLIMQVDPETEEVYFIELKDFDPATGEITAEFPCLGPIIVLTKGEAAK